LEVPVQNRLEWSILALAQPAEVQLSLFPDFTHKPDELVLNLEEALNGLLGHEDQLTEEQWSAVRALDARILAMSGEHHAEFWTEEALRGDPRWEEIRGLAKRAAEVCGWKLRAPPASDDIYVPVRP
jgi:hypothetical protein